MSNLLLVVFSFRLAKAANSFQVSIALSFHSISLSLLFLLYFIFQIGVLWGGFFPEKPLFAYLLFPIMSIIGNNLLQKL